MCGIFGAVALAKGGPPLRHPECLARMAESLRHRGPDGERIVGHARAQLGARRLAIMDLTTGDQPFQSPDGAVWMVCNGEIYNAPDLRREASGWGYPFRSRGDIETIVPFYERTGADAVARLEGMFGLAIWDDHRGRLLLARDRAGEKPLFWTLRDGELRFASEIQALLTFPDQSRRVNATALALYRALGYVPAPHTMFDGIHKLPPAHLLVAEGEAVDARPYWSPAAAASRPSRLASAAELRGMFLRAVERELMSDVPLGVFTSGGLDSSFLVAGAARVMPGERIHTYAARFVEPGYDESRYAEQVTHDIRTVHHVVTADFDSLRRALDVVSQSLAEPFGDPAMLPTYLLSEAARADVKVVLSGEGADELFGGYPTYLGHRAAAAWQRLPQVLRRALRWAVERWPTSTGKVTLEFLLKQFVAAAERPWLERHLAWFGALGADPASGVIPELACKLHGFPHDDPLNRILWLDFLTYLPDNLLVKVDRATMLASVEARAPFLDREVMELVLPAPSQLKVRGFTTKAILREAARGLVPDAVINRRKRGLSVPVARWLNAGLAPLADRLLDTPLLAEHRSGKANHARKLWPLLMLALWAERWGVELDPIGIG
ncbi:MAG TPA: asparagine synthase (glutamine-hydrolyzing) [Gemmatimonadales bacterium]|nr:asparagine synthase (glutamine-hydrolyzing) [Gemmatimonadales bacterium]